MKNVCWEDLGKLKRTENKISKENSEVNWYAWWKVNRMTCQEWKVTRKDMPRVDKPCEGSTEWGGQQQTRTNVSYKHNDTWEWLWLGPLACEALSIGRATDIIPHLPYSQSDESKPCHHFVEFILTTLRSLQVNNLLQTPTCISKPDFVGFTLPTLSPHMYSVRLWSTS